MAGKPTHWVVTLNRRNRSVFFAAAFLALVPHLLAIRAGAGMWFLLAIHLLVYPHLAYWWARRSAKPLRAEFRNLLLDGVLFGGWLAVWGFPLWITFALVVCVLINVVIFEGVAAAWKPVMAIAAGVLVGVLVSEPAFRQETSLWTSFACMIGLTGYLIVCAHYAYQRGVSLRASRRQLSERLAEITDLQARLEELARRDPLTGAYNRRHLDLALASALDRSRRDGRPLSLLLIDIDRFKRINDSHGHPAGDGMIRHLSALLMQRFSGTAEVVCRYGGEEFLVLLPGTDMRLATTVAEQFRAEFAALPMVFDGRVVQATLSMGVSGFPGHELQAAELIRLADRALYAAKLGGRNQVVCVSDEVAMARCQPPLSVPVPLGR